MSSRDDILDNAERRIREGGFHGFSFRDLAADVGIKSSSVHYHFPTKEKLVEEVVKRYSARFLEALGDATDDRSAVEKLETLVDAFRHAMKKDRMMCLCGALGTEIAHAPEPVVKETRSFFKAIHRWVDKTGLDNPAFVVATLEGALLVGRTMSDNKLFESAVEGVVNAYR